MYPSPQCTLYLKYLRSLFLFLLDLLVWIIGVCVCCVCDALVRDMMESINSIKVIPQPPSCSFLFIHSFMFLSFWNVSGQKRKAATMDNYIHLQAFRCVICIPGALRSVVDVKALAVTWRAFIYSIYLFDLYTAFLPKGRIKIRRPLQLVVTNFRVWCSFLFLKS